MVRKVQALTRLIAIEMPVKQSGLYTFFYRYQNLILIKYACCFIILYYINFVILCVKTTLQKLTQCNKINEINCIKFQKLQIDKQ